VIEFTRRLWPILNTATRRRLVAASLCMAFVALLEGVGLVLLIPLLQLLTSAGFSANTTIVGRVGDALGRQGSDLAVTLAVLVLVVYVTKGFAAIAVLRWAAGFAMRQEVDLVERLLRLYLGAPLQVHFELNSSEFQRTINQSLRTIFSQAFVNAFSAAGDLLGVGVVGVVLLVSVPELTAIGVAYFAIVLFVYQRVVNRSVRAASRHVHADQAAVYREVQQALSSVKEVKAAAVELHFVERIATSRAGMLRSFRTIALMSVQPRYVLELAMVGAAAVVAVAAYWTQSPEAATASIAIFLAGGFRILAPLTKVFNGINQAKMAVPSVEQIADDIDRLEHPVAEQLRESAVAEPLEPSVVVHDLSFTYDGSRDVLRAVDLEVAPGETVALVGGSGAGKSTLVDVVLGLLEPSRGSVTVGGHPLGEVRRAWQRSVAYVPQHVTLLDATVRDNVTFGTGLDDTGRVLRALADAQLTEVVAQLPEGLDTRIGERGVRLSGGQRQRLGIARALHRSPSLLVLDEATSSLDNETEAQFAEVLQHLRGRVTIIAIAHRLSTVRDVDRVYFFADGNVLDAGTFDELVARVPDFARLVELSSVSGGAAS
jgi:ABC-type multidrug transport system fused ATPase/permease subunit